MNVLNSTLLILIILMIIEYFQQLGKFANSNIELIKSTIKQAILYTLTRTARVFEKNRTQNTRPGGPTGSPCYKMHSWSFLIIIFYSNF